VSQFQGERKDTAFDGRIQLNGDAAPELEVIVELDDRFLILGHSSGELGRWEKNTVRVVSIGRGWFTLDVEDEQVTFLPRRPGHFAASTIDLVPVEESKKRFRRKARDKKASEGETPALSRKERKLLRNRDAAAAVVAAEPATDTSPVAEPAAPAVEPAPSPQPGESPPPPVESPPAPVEPVPAPDIRPASAPPGSPAEPSSPWDDLPSPEIPGRQPHKKRSRSTSYAPSRPVPDRRTKPPREKVPKPPHEKPVKTAARPRAVQAGPRKKNVFSRAIAGSWHGMKGIALRISDELRQTGIVPFDRLPAAPARTRPNESHEHVFQEHRLPGGLVRNVCHACGLVSIGESEDTV